MRRVTDVKGISPSNYKNGMLISNKYRPKDMAVLVGTFIWEGVWLVLLFLVFVPNIYTVLILLVFLPIIAIYMVQPMTNYHNNYEYIKLSVKFGLRTKRYTNLVVKKKR